MTPDILVSISTVDDSGFSLAGTRLPQSLRSVAEKPYRKGLGLGLIHGYFGGAEKRYTHWWLKRSFFFVVAPKFIFNGGGSKDPTQDWWLK